MGPADHAGLAGVELDRQPRNGDEVVHGVVLVDPATSRHQDNWQLRESNSKIARALLDAVRR